MPKFKDLTGQVFGYWEVLRMSTKRGNGTPRAFWTCKCKCGKVKDVEARSLIYCRSVSCGCHRIELITKHGMTRGHEYKCWLGMRYRSGNRSGNHPLYAHIKVSTEWDSSFEQFLADMGPAPSKKHSIDRIKNELGYFKENCRWATMKEQNRNTSRNTILSFKGEDLCIADWVERTGISSLTIQSRLRYGWSIEKTLTTPIGGTRNRILTLNGRSMTLTEWAKETGINAYTIHARIKDGWTVRKALTTPVNMKFSNKARKGQKRKPL